MMHLSKDPQRLNQQQGPEQGEIEQTSSPLRDRLKSMSYPEGVKTLSPIQMMQDQPVDHGIRPPAYGKKENTYWQNKLEGKDPATSRRGGV
jgi:hypothetical protein